MSETTESSCCCCCCCCCGPGPRDVSANAMPLTLAASPTTDTALPTIETASIPGGIARVGTNTPYHQGDGEGPAREVRIKPFKLGVTCVTNAEFSHFIAATGYVTEAERFGWSFVFYDYVVGVEETAAVIGTEWWRRVDGALWNSPFGPRSSIEERGDYPVVHVSWDDALAFAKWVGGRLPTEAEWEHAARGGLANPIYPWGDQHPDDHEFTPCNIWQGQFPSRDTGLDGFAGLAPARSFEPNGHGLFNMSGNNWEWNGDSFRVRSLKKSARALNDLAKAEDRKLLKGGSHMCHPSYCHRYRIAARMGNTGDSTTGHIGFRIAFDA